MGRGRKVKLGNSLEEVEKIRSRFIGDGVKLVDLAVEFGCKRSTMARFLSKHQIKKNKVMTDSALEAAVSQAGRDRDWKMGYRNVKKYLVGLGQIPANTSTSRIKRVLKAVDSDGVKYRKRRKSSHDSAAGSGEAAAAIHSRAMPFLPLSCAVQNYSWGKFGSHSMVARFNRSANPELPVDENVPFAELWCGTHHRAMSRVVQGPGAAPLTGSETASLEAHAGRLPFLMKILSIRRALSIQMHPDETTAKKLHLLDPKNYGDASNKPEMLIAMTPTEAFCNFRPPSEILFFVNNIPELGRLFVGNPVWRSAVDAFSRGDSSSSKDLLRTFFCLLMHAESSLVKGSLQTAYDRFSAMWPDIENVKEPWNIDASFQAKGEEGGIVISHDRRLARAFVERAAPLTPCREVFLFLRLCRQFPGDVGCFAPFFLNYVFLAPGYSLQMNDNEVHCYLSGDGVEVMKLSDNVIRCALTGKFRDTETMLNNIEYNTSVTVPVVKQESVYTHSFTPAPAQGGPDGRRDSRAPPGAAAAAAAATATAAAASPAAAVTGAAGVPFAASMTRIQKERFFQDKAGVQDTLPALDVPSLLLVTKGRYVRLNVADSDIHTREGGAFYIVPGADVRISLMFNKDVIPKAENMDDVELYRAWTPAPAPATDAVPAPTLPVKRLSARE